MCQVKSMYRFMKIHYFFQVFREWWRILTAYQYSQCFRSMLYFLLSQCTTPNMWAIFLSFSPFSITIKRFLLKIIPFGNFQYSNDVLSFVFNVMCIVCSTIWPSFYSYYATVATEQILTIGDATYNSNWFNYPVKMQKHVVLIVARSQKRVLFSGLNLMYCTVEYFGKVSNPLGYYWIKTIWLEWVWDVEFNLTFFLDS